MNVDAIYNRPLSRFDNIPVAIGGYAEANSAYFGTDGVTEGLSFQMRRSTIFLSSSLCVAADLTLPGEDIRTMTVAAWTKTPPQLDRRPALFLRLAV